MKRRRKCTMHLTNKYFPEITRRHFSVCVIAFPSQLTKRSLYQQQVSYKSSVVVQSVFISCQNASFTRESANSCPSRVVIYIHSNKRATGIRLDIRLTAEVLDYSFTSAVSDRGHVERTSLLFTAVESQLSERQMCSEFFHGALPQKRLVIVIVADSSVWRLHWQLWRGGWAVNHSVGD